MLFALLALAPTCSITPVDLRVENLTAPLGVDLPKPRFSWKLKAASPNLHDLKQTAYRIRVGTSNRDQYRAESGDIWLSEVRKSSETMGIPYAGKQLSSNQPIWWQVQTWDQNGVASEWSKPVSFSTGLQKRDWKAKWITYEGDPARPSSVFDQSNWIWSDESGLTNTPASSKTFTLDFDNGANFTSAVLNLTADDRFDLSVNGTSFEGTDGTNESWRHPREIDISKALKPRTNTIKLVVTNDEPSPAGVIATLNLRSGSQSKTFRTGVDNWLCDGRRAVPVGSYGYGPWGKFESAPPPPAINYVKEFKTTKSIKRATLFGTALGLVDFQINGVDVAQDLFTPGWSDYDKRVYYRAYNVRSLLNAGENNIKAMVGDGWYSGYVGFGRQRSHYGPKPKLIAQLVIEFSDGTRQIIGTDRNWTVETSPITQNDFLMGETYNDLYNDTTQLPTSKAVESPEEAERNLEWFPGNPVRRYARIRPKSIKQIAQDKYLLDFGQNLAGFVKIQSNDSNGIEIGKPLVMRFAEVLQPDGQIYVDNLRAAKATDTYIPSEGFINWQPRFTFHGFRYCEVTGIGRKPKPSEFTAIAISSATPETGKLETSDPMLNKIVKNAWWTQKMNFIDIPTDCPQRDERLGWTGDAQAYIRTASTYSDVQAFFTKWLVALDDDQRKDGQYPMVAPQKVAGDDGGPAWADAGVICPWTIYDVYGDERQLAQHYPNMKRFVDFTKKRSKANLLPPDNYHCFGDWLSINADTPNDIIYEAYFAGSARLVAQSAKVLGKTQDAATYEKLYQGVKKAFNDAYVSSDGKVRGETQCAYVLALAFDLLDKPMADKAADHLIADITARGMHLSTGFVGTRDLMQVLSKIGRNDVAFTLLHNTTFPSWGFEIKNGATTIWERWDGYTPEKGFQDAGMNSFAHYAYGAVVGWMFQEIGGIKNTDAGFDTILVAPQIDKKLKWANTLFGSVHGSVICNWKVSGGKLSLHTVIPPNTTAEIRVPNPDGTFASHSVGSGSYDYSSENWQS